MGYNSPESIHKIAIKSNGNPVHNSPIKKGTINKIKNIPIFLQSGFRNFFIIVISGFNYFYIQIIIILNMEVKEIDINIIFNSMGEKTFEAVINKKSTASSPSGTSKSNYETKNLPVEKALKNFLKIRNRFIGSFTQKEFDSLLRKNIEKFGSSLTTALSLAFFSLNFKPEKFNCFPNVLSNVLAGGVHTFGKTKNEIQEILVLPKANTIYDAIETNFKIWKEIGNKLKGKNKLIGLNQESAWLADIESIESLELVSKVAENYSARIGIDMAASNIFKDHSYCYHNKRLSESEQIEYIINLIEMFNLFYVEDPLEENDFLGFAELNKKTRALICGDDLIATHVKRFEDAINKKSVSAVIIKPNQVGTVSDCFEIIKLAKTNKIISVVSHRSKETCCPVIAKLSLYSQLAKFGVGGIRTAKINELIRLWKIVKNPTINKVI